MSLTIDVKLQRKDFSLCFEGEMSAGITGLYGPSGAGKSTLLHCIAGLIRPDAGRIVLNDTVLYNYLSHTYLPPRKRQIGLVFQDHLLFPHLTVQGNLAYGQKGGTRKERKQHLCEIAELLEVSRLLNRTIHCLSGGEKQRIALGRAILASPRLLLLDEPFSGLDQGLKRQLIPYLKRLYDTTKIPMILVSHNPVELAELADELFFIENGTLYAHGRFNKSAESPLAGRICGSGNPHDFQSMRNHLIRNHSLRFTGNERFNSVSRLG